MNRLSRTSALLGAALSLAMVAGCSGGTGGAVDDSPEAVAFQYRQGIMRAIAYKVGRLRAMTQGEIPQDDMAFTKDAEDVEALAGMLTEGFIPNSIVDGSAALPEIWMNWDDFTSKGQELQRAATELANAARQGGYQAGQGLVQAVGQACGNCHRPYRRRAAEG
ncbi:MAG TPA: cytochrome c [Gammaproteobacteria bacterium]